MKRRSSEGINEALLEEDYDTRENVLGKGHDKDVDTRLLTNSYAIYCPQ